MIRIGYKEKSGDEAYRFKKALKMAKYAIEEICELSEDMEDEFGDDLSERYSSRSYYRRGYSMRDGAEGMDERRGRDSMGRYR